MKCPSCGYENREGRRFCSECGKPLQIRCPSCQALNEPGEKFCGECGHPLVEQVPAPAPPKAPVKPPSTEPTSFAGGRYKVKSLLGEVGKKKVYLVHDTKLDRDVAFALIKTENLDEDARKRVTREAQAMGRLGDHPNIVAIYDIPP